MDNATDQFRLAISTAGFTPPDEVVADGKIHRFSSNGERADDAGWYVRNEDNGTFGCWRSGVSQSWSDSSGSMTTATHPEVRRRRTAAARAARDASNKLRRRRAQAKAAELWQAGGTPESHPYLELKRIKPHGVRSHDSRLLLPMRDTAGTLHSMQTIGADGEKRFLPGGQVKGCYFAIGQPGEVLIVCEGFATGASLHEATGHAVAVAFNAGNLEPAATALREKYSTVKMIIAADDDWRTEGNPGLTHANAAAAAAGGYVAMPTFPAGRPEKATDFNDLFQLAGDEAVRSCIDAALKADLPPSSAGWSEPEPLAASHEPLSYPIEALPSIIREAVEEVISFVKAPVVLAASSAVSVVSVALQGFYDVERAPGLKGPVSLYLLSIAESGERKSTCDGYFKRALETWQQEKTEQLKASVVKHQADLDAWMAMKAGLVEAIKKASRDGKPTTSPQGALFQLEHEKPKPVRVPRLIRGDDTPENLSWSLMHEWPSAGVLSSEAGVVFGSHGMGSDSVTRNLALLNTLWDGGTIPIGRRTSESYVLERARLTMGLQVQESTLRAFFDKSKGLARGTGFLARFLPAWPSSTMGTRFYTDPPDWRHLDKFNRRIRELMENDLTVDDDGRLTITTLPLTPGARAAWVEFQNVIEVQLRPEGELEDVKDVASKTADNAARLAALFHVFEHGAGAVSADAMARGAKVAAWHLTEARRFLGQFTLPAEWTMAARLDRWLIDHCRRNAVCKASTRVAMQYGPLRDKSTLQIAIDHLTERGRVRCIVEGRRRVIEVNPSLLGGLQ